MSNEFLGLSRLLSSPKLRKCLILSLNIVDDDLSEILLLRVRAAVELHTQLV